MKTPSPQEAAKTNREIADKIVDEVIDAHNLSTGAAGGLCGDIERALDAKDAALLEADKNGYERGRKEAVLMMGFVEDYLQHDSDCILSMRSAGEPTADGGYRVMYAGKWYQTRPVDETPKCNCGLADTLADYENFLKRKEPQ